MDEVNSETPTPRDVTTRWRKAIGATGQWRGIAFRAAKAFLRDDIPTAAAGATFYALLAFFPAVGAFVSLYGLIADIRTASDHLSYLQGFLPPDVLHFVADEMVRVATTRPSNLSLALLFNLLLSIWSANAGVSALIAGLNVAYKQKETRGILKYYLVSHAITVCAILGFIGGFVAVVVLSALQSSLGLAGFEIPGFFRWPLLWVMTIAAFAAIYRFAPGRKEGTKRRIWPGSVVAATLWLFAAGGLSWYVANLSNYGRTYGSLAAVVVFMIWLWLGMAAVLFGAKINFEVERQRL